MGKKKTETTVNQTIKKEQKMFPYSPYMMPPYPYMPPPGPSNGGYSGASLKEVLALDRAFKRAREAEKKAEEEAKKKEKKPEGLWARKFTFLETLALLTLASVPFALLQLTLTHILGAHVMSLLTK